MPTSWEKDSGKENARELAQASTRRSSDRRTAVKPAARSEFSCQQSTRSLAFQLARRCAFSYCALSFPRLVPLLLSPALFPSFSRSLFLSLSPLSLRLSFSSFFIPESQFHSPRHDALMIYALLPAAAAVLVRGLKTTAAAGGGPPPRDSIPSSVLGASFGALCASVRG